MYRYMGRLIKVVDGDTIDVEVDLGFYIKQKMRVRLYGIDTPEIRGPEKTAGLAAKAFVEAQLTDAKTLGIRSYKIGNFGRYLSDVYYSKTEIDNESLFDQQYCLNDKLIAAGHARRLDR